MQNCDVTKTLRTYREITYLNSLARYNSHINVEYAKYLHWANGNTQATNQNVRVIGPTNSESFV